MKMKSLSVFLLTIFSAFANSSEIIVCAPLQLSYQQSNSELTIVAKAEEEIPEGLTGYLCNSARSVCKQVQLRTRPATAKEITQAQRQGKFSAGASGTDSIRIRGR